MLNGLEGWHLVILLLIFGLPAAAIIMAVRAVKRKR
jgi:hypothetical protein